MMTLGDLTEEHGVRKEEWAAWQALNKRIKLELNEPTSDLNLPGIPAVLEATVREEDAAEARFRELDEMEFDIEEEEDG